MRVELTVLARQVQSLLGLPVFLRPYMFVTCLPTDVIHVLTCGVLGSVLVNMLKKFGTATRC